MKTGVTLSAFAHASIIGWALLSLSAPTPLEVDDVEALPIDIIPIEEFTKSIKGDKEARPDKQPAPKPTVKPPEPKPAENAGDSSNDAKVEKAEEPAPQPVKEAALPKPAPEPAKKPEPVKTPTLAPEPQPKAEISEPVEEDVPAPAPKPVAKPEPPKPAEPKEVAKPEPVRQPEPEPKTDIAMLARENAELPKPEEEVKPKDETAEETKPTEEPTEDFVKLPETGPVPKVKPRPARPELAKTDKRKENTKPAKADRKAPDSASKSTKDEIANLLNKEQPKGGGAKRSKKKPALGTTRSNNAIKLSQSEVDALREATKSCWNEPVGQPGAEDVLITIDFELDRNGQLVGRPTVKAAGGPSSVRRAYADSAKRAIQICSAKQRYDLPAEKHSDWSEVTIKFRAGEVL